MHTHARTHARTHAHASHRDSHSHTQSEELARSLDHCEAFLDSHRRYAYPPAAAAAGSYGAAGYGGFNAPLGGPAYGYSL